MRRAFVAFLWLMGLASLANGAWMMAHAWSWFTFLPGVIDTGAVNAHFIHDVGIVYAIAGGGFIWCARNLIAARPVFIGITLFYAGHALGHVAEILAGHRAAGELEPARRGVHLMRHFMLAAGLLLSACSGPAYISPPLTGESTPLRPPEEAWARVLKQFVDEQGRVNYAGVSANPQDLARFVAWVAERDPASWPDLFRTPAHLGAFHLNAYNALAMYNMTDFGAPDSLSVVDRLKFFKNRKLFVGGRPLSLDEYRQQIVSGIGDPRVHFALNDMVTGGPRLPREPFRGAALEQQLDREARRFFGEDRNLRVDDARRRIVLSGLLREHQKDFLRVSPTLAAYASNFRDAPLPDGYELEFTDFDWRVNRQ
jgi:hypothetical protein